MSIGNRSGSFLFLIIVKILKRFPDRYNSCSLWHAPKIRIYCQCIQVSREQAWQTTAHCLRIYGRYEQLCCSSTDRATGVKQLSSLAAPGEKMLLNQDGFSNSPSLQGNSKPRGERSLWAAMEAICLVVMAQQVSPGWGTRLLKTSHPARKENSTTGSISRMSTTHGHSLTTHVTTTRVYPYSTTCSHYSVCFELCEGRLPLQKKMLEQRQGEKKCKEQPWPPSAHCSLLVFVWMSQGWGFFFSPFS